jgi:hypothetical protein
MVSMDTLPPFTGDDTHCAKCGNTHASTVYRGEGERSLGDFFNPTRCERLDRVCQRCHFAWSEAIAELGDPGLTSDHDVAVAVRALYRTWYWDADWRTGATVRKREQVLHELYCAAVLGEAPHRSVSQQMADDTEWVIPVVVPHAAFELLLELAQYSRDGGQTTAAGQRALDALAAAGLIPARAEHDHAEEPV